MTLAPLLAAGAPPLRVAADLAGVGGTAPRDAGEAGAPPGLAPPWGDANLAGDGSAATRRHWTRPAPWRSCGKRALFPPENRRRRTGRRRDATSGSTVSWTGLISLSLALPARRRRGDRAGLLRGAGNGRSGPARAVPGAIYYRGRSAWFRDLGGLWAARRDLLTAEAADGLEEQDDAVRQGLKVIGADVAPSELAATLGDSWRVVVAGGLGSDYAVAPVPVLPAVGLAVSLRDAAEFDRLAGPLLRGVRLVATFGGAKMQPFAATETVGGREVPVSGLRFAETPGAARTGDRARFNAAPTWATFRGHFVVASNRPLLRALLTALEHEAAAPAFLPTGVTEEQRFSPAALADALADAAPSVAAGLSLEAGLSAVEAAELVAAVGRALRRVGPATMTTDVRDGLRMTLIVAPPGASR